jgi:hypothetical protein
VTRPTTDSYARIMLNAMQRALADYPDLPITLSVMGPMRGTRIYAIDVEIRPDLVLTYSPFTLDNGADGINPDILISIRRLLGEDIPLRPISAHQHDFSDIITYSALFEDQDRT